MADKRRRSPGSAGMLWKSAGPQSTYSPSGTVTDGTVPNSHPKTGDKQADENQVAGLHGADPDPTWSLPPPESARQSADRGRTGRRPGRVPAAEGVRDSPVPRRLLLGHDGVDEQRLSKVRKTVLQLGLPAVKLGLRASGDRHVRNELGN